MDGAPDAGKGQFHSFFWTAASRPAVLPRFAWGVAQGRDRPRPSNVLRYRQKPKMCHECNGAEFSAGSVTSTTWPTTHPGLWLAAPGADQLSGQQPVSRAGGAAPCPTTGTRAYTGPTERQRRSNCGTSSFGGERMTGSLGSFSKFYNFSTLWVPT